MKTLLLNGSPNAERGNSQIFINKFNEGFPTPCEMACIHHKNPHELALYMREFACVIIVMPLYIHAMPGIVMKLFEAMQDNDKQKLGFIIQLGFSESSQARFAVRILERQTKRLGSEYLGCVINPGAAGVKMMPEKANKQLFEKLLLLGTQFAKTNQFDQVLVKQLGIPVTLSQAKVRLYNISSSLRVMDIMWFMMLRQNHAFQRRRDRPFQNQKAR